MKTKLTMLLACTALLCQTLAALDFSTVRSLKTVSKGNKIILRADKITVGNISAKGDADIQLVKVAVKDGALEIDTGAFFDANPNAELSMRLFGISNQEVKPETTARLTVEMSAAEEGAEVNFSLAGVKRPDAPGKRGFSSKPKSCQLSAEPKQFTYSRRIPADVQSLNALFYLKKGVFSIRSVVVDYPEQTSSQAAGSADAETK